MVSKKIQGFLALGPRGLNDAGCEFRLFVQCFGLAGSEFRCWGSV